MDYKKKYQELVGKIRKAYLYAQTDSTKAVLEDIYPELAESKDERIRKELLESFKYQQRESRTDKEWLNGIKLSEVVAWLEKQGGIDNCPLECSTNTVMTDSKKKVEPKFKVGDWITNGKLLVGQVTSFDGEYYHYMCDGLEQPLHVSNAHKWHLWTIQDANSDVLYSPCCKLLWIFDDEKTCHVGYNLNYNSDSIVIDKPICIPTDVQPATKEQRNLLFQKMKEAGYEWDADKKELKKIEDEEYNGEDYGIDSLWHAKNILEETLGKVDGYQTDDGILEHKCAIAAVNKLYKQKPAWSEEDEKMLNDAIGAIGAADYYTYDDKQELENWLKSLKERYTWKPSDEQMEAFEHFVRSIGESGYASPYENNTKLLYSLLNDLKKL